MAVPRPRARPAAAASSVTVSAGVVAAFPVVRTEPIAVQECHTRRNEEEDDVHDGERPAGLEHRARLIGGPVIIRTSNCHIADADVPVAVAVDAGAVEVADAAQVPDACNQRCDEAQVDEPDEQGVCAAAVVAEEGEDDPGDGEDGDDEEDEDRVGSQGVAGYVAVYEPGEHAHYRNLKMGVSDKMESERW